MKLLRLLVAPFLLAICGSAVAETITVAVASNFLEPARALAAAFERQTGHEVRLSPGSTGKHYAQIVHGAPFDVFLAADSERPERLEREGRIIANSRFTYARGHLVLWAPGHENLDPSMLHRAYFGRIAIANPRTAPYGLAAQQALRGLDLWEDLQSKLVTGENIAQTYQFVATRSAAAGFVAASQLSTDTSAAIWRVPESLHEPIDQQAVLLRDSMAARDFLDYVRSADARALIRRHGYGTP